MVESVDTKDLKSFGYCSWAGSSPASSTKKVFEKYAEVAQLVEHNLAKVRVAGSSPVFRSHMMECPGGGIGRRARFRCEWFCDRAGSSPVLGTQRCVGGGIGRHATLRG